MIATFRTGSGILCQYDCSIVHKKRATYTTSYQVIGVRKSKSSFNTKFEALKQQPLHIIPLHLVNFISLGIAQRIMNYELYFHHDNGTEENNLTRPTGV